MTDKEKAIVMAYTGVAMLVGDKLNVFYEYISGLMNRPVFTHELADKNIWEQIKKKAFPDFLALCESEEEKVCQDNCDKCENGVPIDGQYYDDGTPICECSIRPTEQSEQESKQYALGYQDGFLDAKKMFGGDT